MQVVVRMKQYKDDLLVSCLQLLLSLPNELVKPEFSNLVPALQVYPLSISDVICVVQTCACMFYYTQLSSKYTSYSLHELRQDRGFDIPTAQKND